jgi:hypothetical protein
VAELSARAHIAGMTQIPGIIGTATILTGTGIVVLHVGGTERGDSTVWGGDPATAADLGRALIRHATQGDAGGHGEEDGRG